VLDLIPYRVAQFLGAIPLTLLAVHLAAIPFSGSSVNPARTVGPDLVGNTWTGLWIYLIEPPLGAALAWGIHVGVVRGAEAVPPEPAVAEALREPGS
jgi:glycerol uptake facilitator-like aquaporin